MIVFIILGGKMMHFLDPSCKDEALKFITDLSDSLEDRCLKVKYH